MQLNLNQNMFVVKYIILVLFAIEQTVAEVVLFKVRVKYIIN